MKASKSPISPLQWLAVVAPLAYALPNCPYPGPAFPKPTNLAASDAIQTALLNLTATFDARGADPAQNVNGTSWSIQAFSSSDAGDAPLWAHYHTALNLLTADTPGVRAVDADTVYRLGSLSKIFTVMTFLAEAGDAYWNTPVTRFVPELELLADAADYDPVLHVAWDQITLGALASHTAGIVRDYGIEGELTQENNQTVLLSQGFPPAPANMTPTCGEVVQCNRAQFFEGMANVPPSFAPSRNAGYSNMGYQLLAYALEAITQKSFVDMLQADIINAVGLNRTSYAKPDDAVGVIPPGAEDGWAHDIGEAGPTGNMYASVADLSRLGRAIFRNAVLPAAQTRRWLKPAALTSEIHEGVSYPWGFRRIPLGGNRVADAYSKAGSINKYMSLLVLLPDYDVGFAALLAGNWPGNANWDVADALGEVLLPALEAAARAQAAAAYAGAYQAADGTLNSSLVLGVDGEAPGLGIRSWVSNGTDMLATAVGHVLNYNATGPDARLYPTGLEQVLDDGGRRVAFKMLVENLDAPDRGARMFSTNCGTWVAQSVAVYADLPIDQFVFTLDPQGAVVAVEPLALRARLLKTT
ncbi:beta-lactamase/transpeptidase-like protein [Xylariomycetidae sp. FL0641]|nr:beta-lactamase/transpeptidase-like protein [Xylariomycetidae sp. FL0641]